METLQFDRWAKTPWSYVGLDWWRFARLATQCGSVR